MQLNFHARAYNEAASWTVTNVAILLCHFLIQFCTLAVTQPSPCTMIIIIIILLSLKLIALYIDALSCFHHLHSYGCVVALPLVLLKSCWCGFGRDVLRPLPLALIWLFPFYFLCTTTTHHRIASHSKLTYHIISIQCMA